ncbi:amidase [Salinicola peritrichatus]|uniref:amidase n=1 Tax=Salinicola peritrichatus TaxID=1267424 RepID=UPI000DA10CAC|nr:amidase [Salinicola peritrichatus]
MTQALSSNGFLNHETVRCEPLAPGPLDGLRFAAKDVIDVAGHVTGLGNPTWRATHAPATEHASCVSRMLNSGARFVGKTHTDELAYSLAGQNAHYGTPPNPAAAGRIPGGSSSGSASVVAAGLVDFALGTDTGGSIRIPASYCGLYGLRPTHGVIDMQGVAHLAPSFDTLGWFARDAATLLAVGRRLLPPASTKPPMTLRTLSEAMATADLALSEQVTDWHSALVDKAPALQMGGAFDIGDLAPLAEAFRVCQAAEAWAVFGDWILEHSPEFGPGVRERFEAARGVSDSERESAATQFAALRQQLRDGLGTDTLLCLPTAPASAPALDASPAQVDQVRRRTLKMTAVAGIGGLPQITIPALSLDGPVGVSLIGPPGGDLYLLELAASLAMRGEGAP